MTNLTRLNDYDTLQCPCCELSVLVVDAYSMARHIGSCHRHLVSLTQKFNYGKNGLGLQGAQLQGAQTVPDRCLCGLKLRDWGDFAVHLQRVGDLSVHFAEARLLRGASEWEAP